MENVIVVTRGKGVSYSLDFHSHNYNEMLLLHGGNCRFLVGNQVYPLQPSNLLIFNGNKIHKAYVSGETEAYERSVLHFKESWIKHLLKRLKIEYLLDVFKENEEGIIYQYSMKEESIVESMMSEIEYIWKKNHDINCPVSDAQLKLLITKLLIFFYQSNTCLIENEKIMKDEVTRFVERISNFIFLNYQHPITIDDIARNVGLSKSYMSHLFKEVTGTTIMNYLMAYRLSQARSLLSVDSVISIQEVSTKCGFKNIAHFSRTFKCKLGCTPSEYRMNRLIKK